MKRMTDEIRWCWDKLVNIAAKTLKTEPQHTDWLLICHAQEHISFLENQVAGLNRILDHHISRGLTREEASKWAAEDVQKEFVELIKGELK